MSIREGKRLKTAHIPLIEELEDFDDIDPSEAARSSLMETTILKPLDSAVFSRPLFMVDKSTDIATLDTVCGTWIPNTQFTDKTSSPTQTSLLQNTIQQEIALFQHLQHPHLIQFQEAREKDGKVFIVTEVVVRDTLSALIKGNELDWPTRYRIVQETARGLEYLHNNKVFHRDLRSDNVLLTESMVVKLCGFGSASTKSASTRLLTNSDDDTVRWMAPELFIGTPLFSAKSDVFAFGMVMWQMAAASLMPLESHNSSEAVILIQNGSRDEIPEETPTEYRMMIEQCWDQNPNKRPRAGAMVTLSIRPISASGDRAFISVEGAISQKGGGMSRELPGAQAGSGGRTTGVLAEGVNSQSGVDRNSLGSFQHSIPTHMSQSRLPSQGSVSVHSLRTLVDEIWQRQPRVKDVLALPEVCKSLAVTCEQALGTAQRAPSDTDHQRLAQALAGVSKLLLSMSSRTYVATRFLTLGDKVKAAARDVTEVMSSYSDLPAPSTDIDTQPTVVEPNVLQRELAKLEESLINAPRDKATKLFERGVSVISQQALGLWVTTKLGENWEETNVQQVRFGELFYTTIDGARVLVKRVYEIQGTFKEDTIKRAKALSHWMRHSEGIMQIQAIQFPDLIIYGPTNAIPLDDYLREHSISIKDRWILTFKVASALSYVHHCDVIHRDIRASNIFMVETTPGLFEPKLAGFEICKSDKTESIGPHEVDVWHAPEIREWRGTSKETDVYSFGVLMYEILMGRPPQWEERGTSFEVLFITFERNRSNWVAESSPMAPEYVELMHLCLAPDHSRRPSMEGMFFMLSEGF